MLGQLDIIWTIMGNSFSLLMGNEVSPLEVTDDNYNYSVHQIVMFNEIDRGNDYRSYPAITALS